MNVLELPAHQPTRLIVDARDRREPIPTRSTDATTALTRAVAEYAASLGPFVTEDGRTVQFQSSYDAWAQPENLAAYPAFICYTNDNEGKYDVGNRTPIVSPTRYADGTYEVSSAELELELKCEVWSTDPEERKALVLQLEEAFEPVEWMYGFRLELPHYFNQRATFEPARVTYMGGSGEAIAGFYNARLLVRAAVPKTRVLPFAQVQRIDVRLAASTNDLPLPPPVTR